MTDPITSKQLLKARGIIARKVLELRKNRRWTQAELSRRLDLSQSRFSELERGDGSFTAEQFLEILKLFNVPVRDFTPGPAAGDGAELQNALARLGAAHLHESADVLPSERLSNAADVVREVIVSAELPRLVTGLAPVLVREIDRINLKGVHLQLAAAGAGLERRLAWVAQNTLEATHRELPSVASSAWRRRYRRARVVLESYLESLVPPPSFTLDVLDPAIRSKQTLAEVTAASSSISKRWGIVTSLQPEDFAEALEGARVADA